jgi:hypothetical protein
MSALARSYRVYWFDVEPRAVTADFVSAASDEEAIAKTRAAGFGSKCEIWDGRRLVAQLESERRLA